MRIQGKTALVTGASRGIGRAIAVELARQGFQQILLVARSQPKLQDVALEIRAAGACAIPIPLDLTQPVNVSAAIARAWKTHGPFDLLVNCAGVAHQTSFLSSSLHQAHHELSLNLMGLYTVTRLVGRRMASRRHGTIVNVSSLMGKVAAPTMATYSATKFAIVGFSQALRHELAPHRIRVVTLLPSLTDTDMVRQFRWFRGVTPLDSQQVARALVAGLASGSHEISVGWQSHLALWCQRLLPPLLDRVVRLTVPL